MDVIDGHPRVLFGISVGLFIVVILILLSWRGWAVPGQGIFKVNPAAGNEKEIDQLIDEIHGEQQAATAESAGKTG